MRQAMSTNSFDDYTHSTVVRPDESMRNYPMSNIDYIVQDLYNTLSLYYKVARKRVVYVICI
jgi:hypothetical protein